MPVGVYAYKRVHTVNHSEWCLPLAPFKQAFHQKVGARPYACICRADGDLLDDTAPKMAKYISSEMDRRLEAGWGLKETSSEV